MMRQLACTPGVMIHRRAYANTPDKKVEANVNARSACVNSPYRGGPAGCASTLPLENRRPAPKSSFFFFWTDAGTGLLAADWPAGAAVEDLAAVGLTATLGFLLATVGFFVAAGIVDGIKGARTSNVQASKHGVPTPCDGLPATSVQGQRLEIRTASPLASRRTPVGEPWYDVYVWRCAT